MILRSVALLLVASVPSLAACSRPADSAAPQAATPAATAAPAGMPAPQTAHGPAGQPSVQTVTGTVEETMDAATYTYVRVKADGKEIWAASGQFPVKVGDRVVVPLESPMENFHSNALKRDFPLIYFASLITKEGEQGAPAGMPPGHPAVGGAKAEVVVQKLPPPEGGLAIAAVWKDKDALAGKSVTVRGTVVKFNGGILDRNWMHLQDGSGDAKDGTNDITVTSPTGEAKPGDVITVTGTVVTKKDFGAGYAYAVMLENATVKK